jgi:ATP-dependent exoDNAse (exonuclease V) beta subunit
MSQENNQLIHELSITSPREHDSFDSINVPLVGANLIEASAGTGKTYSIAILALRLVLEKNIPIDKILMVTFTRDAAAEMELRVRNFIREGLQILRKFGEANPNFEGLDAQILNMLKAFPDKNEAQSRLQSALVQFDKAAIYTIHGFCSRILSEYAFESGQMFHATTIEPSDFDQFVTDAFNQAWRNQITVLDERLLNILLKNGLTRKKIYGLMKSAINGKKIYPSFLNQGESIQQCKNRITHELINQDEPAGYFEAMQQQAALIKQSIIQEVVDHREVWINKALADQKKDIREKIPSILSLTNEVELFKVIEEKSDKVFFKNFFPDDFKSKINDYEQKINEINVAKNNNQNVVGNNKVLVTQLISVFALSIYKEVDSQLKKIKEFDGKVTFDDLF